MTPNLNNLNEVSEAGKRIYESQYREEFEKKYLGKYVAIDVIGGSATVGQWPSETMTEAEKNHPGGFFHLMRVGHATAFKEPPYGLTNRIPRR